MPGAGGRLGKPTPLGRSGGTYCGRTLQVGLVFGGTIIALTMGSTPPPPAADALSLGVNELIFPIGCSLVLFSAEALGKRMTIQANSR
jgi:hypothetical protein